MNDPQGIRISKLMAERGLCSRREADAYIERGLVFVNGERVTQLGTRAVFPSTMREQTPFSLFRGGKSFVIASLRSTRPPAGAKGK